MPDDNQNTNGLIIRIDERTKIIVETLDDMREEQKIDRGQIKKNTEQIVRHDERLGVINKVGALIGGTLLGAIIASAWGKFF